MSGYEARHDKPYRRGLILGLTIAEIMILLIFLLLLALSAALANRDRRLALVDKSGASRLAEAVQQAYPDVRTPSDYFKELTRSIAARKQLEGAADESAARRQLVEDAEIGRNARDAAKAAGLANPNDFVSRAIKKASLGKKGEWPPFLSLSEAGGYYFDSGKATLHPEFEAKLGKTIIPLLRKFIDDYDVNVVEVIGHTDEVPMVGTSNLDKLLIPASASKVAISALQSTDNAGLAIARAVAVVHILRADPRLEGVTILPLSGAQLIAPTDRPADGLATGDDQHRRRIEIRLRRTTEQAVPQKTS
jgi:outer membrane protein OmpA-like peptidoglycan-associated protein